MDTFEQLCEVLQRRACTPPEQITPESKQEICVDSLLLLDLMAMSLAQQAVPPTAHLDEISADYLGVRHVRGEGLNDVPLRAAVSNSFAFGGSNAVLAFKVAAR